MFKQVEKINSHMFDVMLFFSCCLPSLVTARNYSKVGVATVCLRKGQFATKLSIKQKSLILHFAYDNIDILRDKY